MDFLKKAMDSVSAKSTNDTQKPTPQQAEPQKTDQHSSPPTDLLSSAKVLAGAAQSTLKHEDFDKSKAADAAGDVLHAASESGKLEEKGYGEYVEKAETYLHQYGSGSADAAAAAAAAATTAETTTEESASTESVSL